MSTASHRTTETRSVLLLEEHAACRQALTCVLNWCAGYGHLSQDESQGGTRDRSLGTVGVVIADLCLADGDGLDTFRTLYRLTVRRSGYKA
jgi:hypothetical protein